MMDKEPHPVRLLLVEDNPGDARHLRELLFEAGPGRFDVVHRERLEEALSALRGIGVDAVLLDLSLPDSRGLDTVTGVLTAAPAVPIVVLTGNDDEDLAGRAVRAGAQDYLIKGQVTGPLLARAVRYAVERKRLEGERDRLLSQERKLRDEAETARDDARRAMGQRDEVLAIVSHDLRSPLSTIILGVSAALDRGEMSEPTARVLTSALGTGHRMKRLIESLLDVASIEAGQLSVDPCRQDVGELLRGAAAPFEPELEKQGLSLEVAISEGLPQVYVDVDRIRQVVFNLLSNAIRYTPQGGRIEVRAEPAGASVRISVADTGTGIELEDRELIFGRFWRPKRPGQEAGTGLGLAIVRGIVEAHGGRIWVESAMGEGSRFYFTVPVASGPENG